MKKDVLLSISSEQRFEGCPPEHVDLVTQARLYRRGGKYFISYEESELTGLEGTRTMLKLDGKTVSMVRTGTYPSEMLFAEHQRHVGLYQTDFGSMTVSTHASRVDNAIGDDGGRLVIDYTVEVDNSLVGEHHFELRVDPTSGELDGLEN